MRVLIVEDEPYMAEAIRDGLRLEAIAKKPNRQTLQAPLLALANSAWQRTRTSLNRHPDKISQFIRRLSVLQAPGTPESEDIK